MNKCKNCGVKIYRRFFNTIPKTWKWQHRDYEIEPNIKVSDVCTNPEPEAKQ